MQRIDSPDHLFHDGDPFNNVQGTMVTAAWATAIQEEVANVIEGAGITLNPAVNTQLRDAIDNLIAARSGNYALDSGVTGNAYEIALVPAVAAYANGMSVRFRTSRANTGAATINAGAGPVALKREDGIALSAGDISPNSITVATYVGGAFLINESVASQFGTLAKKNMGQGLEDDGTGAAQVKLDGTSLVRTAAGIKASGVLASKNIGQGLEDDGAGAARVKLADSSLRRTATGIQTSEPVTYFSGALSVVAAGHMTNFISTASGTITVARTTTLWNGFGFSVDAHVGDVTVAPNALDKIDGGTVGATYLVPAGTSASFIGDGAGNIAVMSQTAIPGASPAPQYVSAARSISAGQWLADSSAGPFSLTLPASPANGTAVRIIDGFNAFWSNNVSLIPGAGDRINDNTGNLVIDVSGVDLLLTFKSGNWSIQ